MSVHRGLAALFFILMLCACAQLAMEKEQVPSGTYSREPRDRGSSM